MKDLILCGFAWYFTLEWKCLLEGGSLVCRKNNETSCPKKIRVPFSKQQHKRQR